MAMANKFALEAINTSTSPVQGSGGNLEMRGDAATLARMGKKPILKRNFGFISILGFSCTVLITWEASLALFLIGYQNGGPAGVIYGYILVWLGTLSVFATLSELVSMAPIAGGQYHWVAMLSPKSCSKFLGYMTGWLTVVGWQATVGSGSYITGTLIQGILILTRPEYEMKDWHAAVLSWGVVLFALLINTTFRSLLPRFESLILILHVLGFFAVLIPFVRLSPHGEASEVFTTWLNMGNWSSQGLSFCIGLLGTVFAFVGGDGAIHMAEEIQNAPTVVPWSIMIGIIINGSLGFAMVVAMLLCLGDIGKALKENPLYPFMAVFNNSLQSVGGAAVMASLVTALGIFADVGILASSSRMFWSFARDRGMPGWRILTKVSDRTSIPKYAVFTTTLITCLLVLITIGSAAAYNGIISISIAGLFASYLMVASLLLFRRCTGGIEVARDIGQTSLANTAGAKLCWGPWKLPGVFGIINNTISCLYLTFILFFSFWPSYSEVTPATMNWSILVAGSVILFSIVYYLAWARKTYKGPIVEVAEGESVESTSESPG